MSKAPFNIQDQYLNQARKERVKVVVRLMSGESLEGHIKSFDNFSLLLDAGGDILLYKHAIATITSLTAPSACTIALESRNGGLTRRLLPTKKPIQCTDF